MTQEALSSGFSYRFDGTRYICDARPGDRLLLGPDGRVWVINQDHPPRLLEPQDDGTWKVRDMTDDLSNGRT